MTDLTLCKVLGMSYDDVRALPRAVYEIAVEDLQAAYAARDEVPV